MILNIILSLTMYPTMLILFAVFMNQTVERNNMVFGVHLPVELFEAPEVAAIKKNYKKNMWIVFIFTLITPVACYFIKHESIQFSIWMIWFCGAIAAFMVPFGIGNKKIIAFRDASGYTPEKKDDGISYAELKVIRTVSFIHFLPQVLICGLLTVLKFLFDSRSGLMYPIIFATFTLATLAFYWAAVVMDKMRVSVLCDDSTINENYARAKKNIWKKVWIGESVLNTAAVVAMFALSFLEINRFWLFMGVIIVTSVVGIAVMVVAVKKVSGIDKSYLEKYGVVDQNSFDDDRYWIWGMFYYNPNDKHTMVDKRFGIGTTTNMATKSGKVINIIGVAAMLLIPITCIWMILEDFTPRHIALVDNTIVCSQINEDYTIDLGSVTAVELMTELPENRSKDAGTAFEGLEKGRFSARGIGQYIAFYNPDQDIFIRLDTADNIYIINGVDDTETFEIYNTIK